ncbi:MAG: hypothetical protein Q4D21_04885 [Phascolarctobacterium sp.]|nr:hypothetical protein [Phascolarctobacterium sp.]
MLYDYLLENFKTNTLIFLNEIKYAASDDAIRQQMKMLVDQGRIRRYVSGAYYIPETLYGVELTPSINDYISKKFLLDGDGDVIGYIGGLKLVNEARLTTQFAGNKYTIYTNKATTGMKTIKVKEFTLTIKKPICPITNENYLALKFLTMLLDSELYAEVKGQEYISAVKSYRDRQGLDEDAIMTNAALYPDKIYSLLYNGGLLKYVG